MEEERAARLICSEMFAFSAMPRELWIRFPDKEGFLKREQELYEILDAYDGTDETIIYCNAEKAIKRLPKSRSTQVCENLLVRLNTAFGQECVKVVEKTLEKRR